MLKFKLRHYQRAGPRILIGFVPTDDEATWLWLILLVAIGVAFLARTLYLSGVVSITAVCSMRLGDGGSPVI
jgi:hypothetical protein